MNLKIPLISAGFPSPAENFTKLSISLDKYLIKNSAATFMAYVDGHSMRGLGLNDGDIMIIDRSITPSNGNIVIALIDDRFIVKQLCLLKGFLCLVSGNDKYPPIRITDDIQCEIWGVVTFSINKHL